MFFPFNFYPLLPKTKDRSFLLVVQSEPLVELFLDVAFKVKLLFPLRELVQGFLDLPQAIDADPLLADLADRLLLVTYLFADPAGVHLLYLVLRIRIELAAFYDGVYDVLGLFFVLFDHWAHPGGLTSFGNYDGPRRI
jgi:hypothetical protein